MSGLKFTTQVCFFIGGPLDGKVKALPTDMQRYDVDELFDFTLPSSGKCLDGKQLSTSYREKIFGAVDNNNNEVVCYRLFIHQECSIKEAFEMLLTKYFDTCGD